MEFADRKLVYIAGPYANPDPVWNTHETIKAADAIQDHGTITAFVPHLTLLWHIVVPHDVGHWYTYDLAVLKRCDALYRLEGKSSGADNEVDFACYSGIPVFTDVDELLKWADPGA